MPVPEGEKTLPGTLLGTPGYTSPEQTEGEADAPPTCSAWAACCTGRPPESRPSRAQTPMQKIRSTLFETPRPPQEFNPSLPAPLCHLILRLLRRKPEDRPATALAVARVLETMESSPAGPPLAVLVPGGDVPAAVPVAAAVLPRPLDRRLAPGRRRSLCRPVSSHPVAGLALPQRLGPEPRKEEEEAGYKPEIGRIHAKKSKRPERPPTPAEDVRQDFKFAETWVTRPEPFKGVQGWAIHVDGVGKVIADAFAFTEDERLLIHYTSSVIPQFLPRWSQFDPQTCGLMAAPFDGSYLSLRPDAHVCPGRGERSEALGGREPCRPQYSASPGPAYAAAFAPDGVKIATFDVAGTVQTVWFWDVQKGTSLGNCTVSSLSLSSAVQGWSPANDVLAVGGQTGVALFRASVEGSHARQAAAGRDRAGMVAGRQAAGNGGEGPENSSAQRQGRSSGRGSAPRGRVTSTGAGLVA